MSPQVISIIGLVLIFALATLRSVNMGAVAFLGAFLLGTFVFGQSSDDLFAGFPGDLFVTLVGVTLLFAIAKANGTVDWLIHSGVRAVRGRIALIPWVMFVITGLLTMVGAVVPGAVAMMAPIGLNFATRYRINPLLMGLLIINGASAGGFSPISIFGSITNGVVERSGLPGDPVLLWISSMLFNLLLSVAVFYLFGGRKLLGRRVGTEPGQPGETAGGTTTATTTRTSTTLDGQRITTLTGLGALAIGALALEFDVGLLSLSIATVIVLLWPEVTKKCVAEVAWPTVLLVCGVVTYVSLMESVGTIEFLGNGVVGIGVPLLAAFVICLIGGGVSAFASTTGILGALIPLAVPFLQTGQVGAVGLIIALAISSSVVDSSPFSTSGALVVANAPEEQRDATFKGLMAWGMSMIAVAPVLTCAIFVLPGWL
ncbi:transporter, UIT1 family (TC 9.B.48) [Saccharopolyspora kobensis]|uniref:Transporter, UIT1 family n=1 Tax=Saccharopolyspora kobensis TaxID=146035 RepID=A0A1H5ZWN9_9PSEU|nr:SLC13 family permease [Saccharopolyspora kobensis]SEG40572.1 transporter, UIT1 family (TC 9.B.48) [Saccharopolyspora kobensis]SFE15321.1 transporter, UIT1 family [Saccharopolyspora kobensis]